MESGVLKYSESNEFPIIDGLEKIWGAEFRQNKAFTRNHLGWIKVKGPKVGKTHPKLGYMLRGNVGLYCVFCEEPDWAIFDPATERVTLEEYGNSASAPVWLFYRFDGTVPDPKPGAGKNDRIAVSNAVIKLSEKPSSNPNAQNPLIIGNVRATKIWPSIPSTIGTGNRIVEAEPAISELERN